jgi:hypothetical protein
MSVNIAIAQKRGKQMLNRRIDSIAGLVLNS